MSSVRDPVWGSRGRALRAVEAGPCSCCLTCGAGRGAAGKPVNAASNPVREPPVCSAGDGVPGEGQVTPYRRPLQNGRLHRLACPETAALGQVLCPRAGLLPSVCALRELRDGNETGELAEPQDREHERLRAATCGFAPQTLKRQLLLRGEKKRKKEKRGRVRRERAGCACAHVCVFHGCVCVCSHGCACVCSHGCVCLTSVWKVTSHLLSSRQLFGDVSMKNMPLRPRAL